MAAKSKVMASSIGSMPWLDQENQQVAQFIAQEADDFAFSVRNELDFLNEHMAEIFSKNQVNMTEAFKTPGKLRGKTPRTARKRNPLEVREPLNDIFAPNAHIAASPSRGLNLPKEQRQFQVAKDAAIPKVEKKMKFNNDSGYHGMTEDEMELVDQAPATVSIHPEDQETAGPLHLEAPNPGQSREQSALDSSFHSAKEDLTRETSKATSDPLISEPVSPQAQASNADEPAMGGSLPRPKQSKSTEHQTLDLESVDRGSPMDGDIGNDSLHSPSEGPSPATKGLVRKSSLTFATLPAREPLTTKKSIGARLSRTSHVDVSKGIMSRGSFLGRITGRKSLGGSLQPETAAEIDDNDQMDVDDSERPRIRRGESDSEAKETKLHNKSSTQRLHDRIKLLGKSQPARPTKSITAATALSQAVYPELHLGPAAHDNVQRLSREDEEDDDWIQPPAREAAKSPRPPLSKSASADVMENLRGKTNISDEEFGREQQQSLRRHSLESERASPNVAPPVQAPAGTIASPSKANEAQPTFPSTTPISTPILIRHADGPISASKSKLQSIMKTARGLFTTSAGASAQAKMELRNQAKLGSPDITSLSKPTVNEKDVDLYPKIQVDQTNLALPAARPENPAKPTEGRRTRGSIEKEKKEKERRQADMESEKSKYEETQKTTTSKHGQGKDECIDTDRHEETPSNVSTQPPKSLQQPARKLPDAQHTNFAAEAVCDNEQDNAIAKVSQPQPPSQQSQLQRPREVKRPVKPPKETAPKPEPQRVAIRVGTLSQRIPLSNAALSSGLQDSLPPPPNKQAGLSKKTSTASMQTSASSTSLRSAAASKPKALIAAEKKKEQDEREVQRKLEQKREIERKRTAQQEEARRQEQLQRREAEKQREQDRAATAEDPKKAAQRQAIEKRRQELAKKDQQRTAPAPQQQIPSNSRPELGVARLSKLHATQDFGRPPINHHSATNPAKAPIKRVFEHETDEPVRQSRLPGGQPYQANDAKRRRTNDETPEQPNVRPTMLPPKRQSNLLKDAHRPYGPSLLGPPSSVGNGYPHNKAPLTNHTYQSQYQHQVQASRPGQAPQDVAKYANGRIVFAENNNPAYPSHKTPNHSGHTNQPFAKSSPQYVNGENIQLEDIPTDSDEGDSEDESDKKAKGAMLPSWVQSPVLNELLREQERNKDPDSIFGPSAAVNMEEMFKERHHRFRSRTSSANWAGNDRLTEEEIRSDNAGREKMRKEGGWTFGL
ncbi:MAG: hypothetical protein LQ343_004175 [Gyalolechia ehrenbergii]|nr:MAG: hypothetical protein LQ343_004175 [Gyalolechia ehrenbergii]